MRYVEVAGVRLSVVGLGAWQFGSRGWGYGESYAQVEAGRIVGRALELGINLVDTAEVYGLGRSERIVGDAVSGRRAEVFLATKLFPLLPVAPVVEARGRASARRLGVEAIDLYQIHQPNPVVPMRTQMDGMRHLLAEGIVKHVGVSNFSLSRWQAAEAELGEPILSNQVSFSLIDRRPLDDLVPWAAAHDRMIISYSPLAQGVLSGRYDAKTTPKGMRAFKPLFLPENLDRAKGLIDALRDVAKSHDASPAQVALAWVIRRPNVVAIPGASSVGQLEENAAAADLELSEADDSRLLMAAEEFRPLDRPDAMVKLARRHLPFSGGDGSGAGEGGGAKGE